MTDLNFLETLYDSHAGLCNAAILVLVFGGMARIAHWREQDGLRVGGMLAVGISMLLTVALVKWAHASGRSVIELGPFAAGMLVMAILITGWAAFRKSTRL